MSAGSTRRRGPPNPFGVGSSHPRRGINGAMDHRAGNGCQAYSPAQTRPNPVQGTGFGWLPVGVGRPAAKVAWGWLRDSALALLACSSFEHLGFVFGDGLVRGVLLGQAFLVLGGHAVGAGLPVGVLAFGVASLS
jgi:hypothetical protein